MTKELQTLNQRIAERIGKDLVDLIPPDDWQRLVDTEIRKFQQDVAPQIIQELMREAYIAKAKVTIDKLTNTSEWSAVTQQQVNTELEQFIGAAGGVIFAGVMSPAMSMVLHNLKNQVNGY